MPCELRPTGRKVGGGGVETERTGVKAKRRGVKAKRGGGQTKEEGGSKKRSGVRKKTGGVKKKLCRKVLAGAVNLSGGEILCRPVFGSKFGSKKEAMQDFVAGFLFRSSATAKVLHVQLATPIVKCEPAWKLRKNSVVLMFNHKRSHPRTLAACGIMSIMMFFDADYTVITIKILWALVGLYCHYHHGIILSA